MLDTVIFPDPRSADPYGLVAIGGDYRPRTLLAAYCSGIFPWPAEDLPHAWYSPDPRFVLPPEEIHVGRSLRKAMRRRGYGITFDTAFSRVIHACATVPRPRPPELDAFEDDDATSGTWIVPELLRGFESLHRQGWAHSVETWHDGRLVGGLYGLAIGGLFCGESMFAHESDASKIAFVALAERLAGWGFRLIDCQVHTDHLARFGARDWPRERFLGELERALEQPTRLGPWRV